MLTEIANHLWQSTLVALAIAALAAILRDESAASRYWLWWAASVKFFVPFSLLAVLGKALGDAGAPRVDLVDWPMGLASLAAPVPEAAATGIRLGAVLLGVWAAGFLIVAGAWATRALKVRSLLRASTPYGAVLPQLPRRVTARISNARLEPALIGIVRPVLMLPRGLTDHLSRTQLDAVLEHEISHWRRGDNLTAAVHMLVEALFWFHPLVWWIGARLVEERERACDEAVVRAGYDGRTYAEGILNVCERYVASALRCAAGISGADLTRRVVAIGRNKVMRELPVKKKVLLASFGLFTLLVPIIFGAAAQDLASPRAIVRINPVYPPTALAAKREGIVELAFTIAANGTTKDVVIVESSSPEFEAPSVTALLRWRFLPTNVTCVGTDCQPNPSVEPLERAGMRTIMRYQLEADSPRIGIETP